MVNLVKEDVLNLLQIARNLLQTGKSPQLILKDLLNCHRDLLLVKATPENCKSLLLSNLEYDKLDRLASKISLKRIENNLEQLQKREQQLRFSINNAVWLETCLLNMMDATCIEEARVKKSDQQYKAKTTRVKVNLVNLWSSIVKSSKSSNQKMLSHGSLTKLDRESNLAD